MSAADATVFSGNVGDLADTMDVTLPASYDPAFASRQPLRNESSVPVTIYGAGQPVVLKPGYEVTFEWRHDDDGGWQVGPIKPRAGYRAHREAIEPDR